MLSESRSRCCQTFNLPSENFHDDRCSPRPTVGYLSALFSSTGEISTFDTSMDVVVPKSTLPGRVPSLRRSLRSISSRISWSPIRLSDVRGDVPGYTAYCSTWFDRKTSVESYPTCIGVTFFSDTPPNRKRRDFILSNPPHRCLHFGCPPLGLYQPTHERTSRLVVSRVTTEPPRSGSRCCSGPGGIDRYGPHRPVLTSCPVSALHPHVPACRTIFLGGHRMWGDTPCAIPGESSRSCVKVVASNYMRVKYIPSSHLGTRCLVLEVKSKAGNMKQAPPCVGTLFWSSIPAHPR